MPRRHSHSPSGRTACGDACRRSLERAPAGRRSWHAGNEDRGVGAPDLGHPTVVARKEQGPGHVYRRSEPTHPQQRRSRLRPPPPAGTGAVAARLPRLVAGDGTGGGQRAGGVSPHRHLRRPQRLGELRLHPDAGLPLGRLPRGPRAGSPHRLRGPQGRAGLATGAGRLPGGAAPADRDPGRYRAGLGRAAAPSRANLSLRVRPAEPLPDQRRGGTPPLGDGLPAPRPLRPRRARGGAGVAGAALRRRRPAPHPHRVQRADPGLARAVHVHLPHRSRRQVPAPLAGRIGLRPAGPHLPVHADRGGPPHVRRHHRSRPRRAAHLRGHARARHRRRAPVRGDRPADLPEVPELPLQCDAGPLRRRDLHQRRRGPTRAGSRAASTNPTSTTTTG